MKRIQFTTLINAPRETVWDTLWNDHTYREWTSVFSEGSRAVTDWKKGSKVLFLGASEEGMVSMIEDNVPNEFMSIKHLGVIKNGIEDLNGYEATEWQGSLENYTLKAVNGKTQLTVDMDVTSEYEDHFNQTWPKAMEKLKVLAERQQVPA